MGSRQTEEAQPSGTGHDGQLPIAYSQQLGNAVQQLLLLIVSEYLGLDRLGVHTLIRVARHSVSLFHRSHVHT